MPMVNSTLISIQQSQNVSMPQDCEIIGIELEGHMLRLDIFGDNVSATWRTCHLILLRRGEYTVWQGGAVGLRCIGHFDYCGERYYAFVA